jgi:hypothetical protein
VHSRGIKEISGVFDMVQERIIAKVLPRMLQIALMLTESPFREIDQEVHRDHGSVFLLSKYLY